VVLVGMCMPMLDAFIVNVSIPSIQHGLHANGAEVQLVVAGYQLAFAAGLVTGGRLGDLFGRRRLFAIGMALFTVTSIACGVAPTAIFLIVARVLQGLAASLLFPQVLSIINVTYTGSSRARAFTVYGIAVGLASVSGQLIGGLLINADILGLGWRSCFLVNAPIGIITLAVLFRVVPESRSEQARRLDLTGATLITLGVALLVLPLIEGRELGWPAWAWVCLGLAVLVLGVAAAHQRRRTESGRDPLLDLRLFTERAFDLGLLIVLVYYASTASFFLVLALYLQEGLGMGALESGLMFTTFGVGFFVASMLSQGLAKRLGNQALALGAVIRVVALGVLAVVVSTADVSGTPAVLIPALVVDGVGMGFTMAPLIARVLAGIRPELVGNASGVFATVQQVAAALGVAIIGIIFYGALTGGTGTYSGAFRDGVIYVAVLDAVVAGLLQLLPRHAPAEAPRPVVKATATAES
jgi:EmrB/QacA subfamily drug resistance transporter